MGMIGGRMVYNDLPQIRRNRLKTWLPVLGVFYSHSRQEATKQEVIRLIGFLLEIAIDGGAQVSAAFALDGVRICCAALGAKTTLLKMPVGGTTQTMPLAPIKQYLNILYSAI